MSELIEELKGRILETVDVRGIAPEDMGKDTTFFEGGLNLDSIDVLELAVMIEEEYGVVIDNKELGEKVFITLGTLADYVRQNRAA
ncbi:MAG: phosphopantetheine-binding protein [Desulfatibacillaceae bacterium]